MSLDDLALAVSERVSQSQIVQSAYLFGSRVKGTHASNSDLDVAIELEGDDEGFVNWMFEGKILKETLQALVPIRIDLQMIHSTDNVVKPAVMEHGIKVYERRDE